MKKLMFVCFLLFLLLGISASRAPAEGPYHGSTTQDTHSIILPDSHIYGSKAIVWTRLQPQKSNLKKQYAWFRSQQIFNIPLTLRVMACRPSPFLQIFSSPFLPSIVSFFLSSFLTIPQGEDLPPSLPPVLVTSPRIYFATGPPRNLLFCDVNLRIDFLIPIWSRFDPTKLQQ